MSRWATGFRGSGNLQTWWSMWHSGWRNLAGSQSRHPSFLHSGSWRSLLRSQSRNVCLWMVLFGTSSRRSAGTRPGRKGTPELVLRGFQLQLLWLGRRWWLQMMRSPMCGSMPGSSWSSSGRHWGGMTPWGFHHPWWNFGKTEACVARSWGVKLREKAEGWIPRSSSCRRTVGSFPRLGLWRDGRSLRTWAELLENWAGTSCYPVRTSIYVVSEALWFDMLRQCRCRELCWTSPRSVRSRVSTRAASCSLCLIPRASGRNTQSGWRWSHGLQLLEWIQKLARGGAAGSLRRMRSMQRPPSRWCLKARGCWPRRWETTWTFRTS